MIDSTKKEDGVSTSYNKVKSKNSSPAAAGPQILLFIKRDGVRGTIMVMDKKDYREKILTKIGNDYLFTKENLRSSEKIYDYLNKELDKIHRPFKKSGRPRFDLGWIIYKKYYDKMRHNYLQKLGEETQRINALKKAKNAILNSDLCELKRIKKGKDTVFTHKKLISLRELLGVNV